VFSSVVVLLASSAVFVSIVYSGFVSALTNSVPTIVQFSQGGTTGGSDSYVQFTFAKQVDQGDRILLCLGVVSSNSVNLSATVPSDSLGTIYSPVESSRSESSKAPGAFASAWIGKVPRNGTDIVSDDYQSGPATIFGNEISGNVLCLSFSEGANIGGSSTSAPVLPYSAIGQTLVVACGGFYKSGGLTPGLGYTLDAENFPPGDVDNGAEHVISNGRLITSPIQFGFLVPAWTEVSVDLNPSQVSQSNVSTTTTTLTQLGATTVTVIQPTTSTQVVQLISATTVIDSITAIKTQPAPFLSDPATQILFVIEVFATIAALCFSGLLILRRQMTPR